MNVKGIALLAGAATAILLPAGPALAYVGPGAGLTLLGALWGLVLAIVVSIGFVLLWPLRRLMRRRRQSSLASDQAMEEDPAHSMPANPSNRDSRSL
jgi:membrane protein implicated in regulation of membrane protease activity